MPQCQLMRLLSHGLILILQAVLVAYHQCPVYCRQLLA